MEFGGLVHRQMVIALLQEEKAYSSGLRGVHHVFQITQVKKHEKVVSSRWLMKMKMKMKMEKEKDENELGGELKIDLLHLRNILG